MKNMILVLAILILLSGCYSSGAEAKAEADAKAEALVVAASKEAEAKAEVLLIAANEDAKDREQQRQFDAAEASRDAASWQIDQVLAITSARVGDTLKAAAVMVGLILMLVGGVGGIVLSVVYIRWRLARPSYSLPPRQIYLTESAGRSRAYDAQGPIEIVIPTRIEENKYV